MKYLHKLLLAIASASFFVGAAQSQTPGTLTNHAFAIGKGPGVTGYTSLLCASAQVAVGQSAADPICRTLSADATMDSAGAVTLANSTTTRSHLGLAIGTNVEAWDADLDCVAAISTTGLIKRTGTGTCSAGAAALSDLATGSQDTVIGYWGGTTASAIAINNCAGALTYSTTTHTFGCNASAGTGTVTSATISPGTGMGSFTGTCTITTTGTCTINGALATNAQQGVMEGDASTITCTAGVCSTTGTSFSNSIGADVNMTTVSYFDGPSTAQGTSGTWFASGTVTITDTSTATTSNCKLWDGTTVIASARASTAAAAFLTTISLSGVITSPAANIKISCTGGAATTFMKFNASGNSKDSTLTVRRLK